jgi:hypothetical protein
MWFDHVESTRFEGSPMRVCALWLWVLQADENVGMPMVFTLCEGIKEWLLENNEEAQDDSMHAQMLRRQQQKEKEKLSAEKAKAAQASANRTKVTQACACVCDRARFGKAACQQRSVIC